MTGDVVPQLLCVVLTGAVVGILIAVYSTAMGLPFGTTSDAGLATGILIGAAVIASVVMRLIRGALRLRHPA